jgi:NTP pyrophosphatase (non-canonical NTP hydrolase)
MNKTVFEYPELRTLLSAYQDWTPTTAIYKPEDEENYLIAGLAAEIFEYAEDSTSKELGDCFWFMSQVANMLQFEMGDILAYVAVEPTENPFITFYSAYAKGYRKSLAYPEFVESLRISYYQVLKFLIELAEEYHESLTKVLVENQEKLESRKTRGTLEGSGGDR